ncbi:hypothetical protein MMSR116_24900 [Methylobacterium mesophilicum SR1.6/6]|uniref:DUF2335 domain-containing protein n=1 Tax=Methylobacterium mesophilicum SR1.6/6 TaxID=908290 RepID=A0A6B9FRW8_9HYPH|nr:DUF2335 domain-containing protein [Methylobacterium mesophilicum]QGY04782.1 hypothetical protein MMSR116_24900 [Methylobacterium mesophilicum SR1.6/6]
MDVLPRGMIEHAAAALEGVVEPDRRIEAAEKVLSALQAKPVTAPVAAQLAAQMTVTATHTQYIGRFPPEEMIAGYERARPGLGERVIAMGEADQAATIASESRQQWMDFTYKVLGLIAGVICLFGVLWYVAHLSATGHDGLAGGVLATFGTGLIGLFVNAYIGRSTASAQPPPAVLVPPEAPSAATPPTKPG